MVWQMGEQPISAIRDTGQGHVQPPLNELLLGEQLRALGRVFSAAAHDVRNHLAVILGMTELALNQELTPDVRQYLDVARRAALEASALLKRLRVTSASQHEEDAQVVDVNGVLSQTVAFCELRRKEMSEVARIPVELKVEFGGPIEVMGDPTLLRVAVTNIALNAFDALWPGGGTVFISTRVKHPVARIVIQDTGTGISDEVRDRLFEPFFTTKGERGTGLGLATAREIVERLGGSIEVHSIPGQGSTFAISLPLAACSASVGPHGEVA